MFNASVEGKDMGDAPQSFNLSAKMDAKGKFSLNYEPSLALNLSQSMYFAAKAAVENDTINNVWPQLLYKPRSCDYDSLFWLRADYASSFLMA